MRIVTPQEMLQIEKRTYDDFKMNESLIIENVGSEAAYWFEKKFIKNTQQPLSFIFLLGKGNNGADGLAIARHLVNLPYANIKIMAFCLYPLTECSKEFSKQLQSAEAFGLRVTTIRTVEDLSAYLFHVVGEPIIVDALFGSGIRLPLPNNVYDVIRFVNDNAKTVVSIDIASGVEGESGKTAGSAIIATHTLAIGAAKLGCFVADGVAHSGEIHLISAGFPYKLFFDGDKFQIDPKDFTDNFFYRSRYAHKNTNGHTLVIGGSTGLTGALILASQASLRSGTGLVTAATWEKNHLEYLVRQVPEVMSAIIPTDDASWSTLGDLISKYDSIVVGPGLGTDPQVRTLLKIILTKYKGPLVIDADAIKMLNFSEDSDLIANRQAPTVLTPHLGEFSSLISKSKDEIYKNSLKILKDVVHRSGAIVLLKGPCTSIALPSGKVFFNFSPNEAMATGGTGDVLAGMIGGLLAQVYARNKSTTDSVTLPFEIAEKLVLMAVKIHSAAGEIAKAKVGVRAMTASHLLDNFTDAFNEFEKMVYHKS